MKIHIDAASYCKDHSGGGYEEYAILRCTGNTFDGCAYIIAAKVLDRQQEKVRVDAQSLDTTTLYRDLVSAMKALRAKVRWDALHTEQKTTRVSQSSKRQLANALALLGLETLESEAQVRKAFIAVVRSCDDGQGGYTRDMDALTRAKEYALSQLASV